MEKVKRMVMEIAYTIDFSNLSLSHRSLLPLLSGSSFLYSLSLSIPHHLYFLRILRRRRQHIGWSRDLEIVMVNALMPWGINQLLPFGPLRETLQALVRADALVLYHADLVSEQKLANLKLRIQDIKETLGPLHIDRLHYIDHYLFQPKLSSKCPSLSAFNQTLASVGPSLILELHDSGLQWKHYPLS